MMYGGVETSQISGWLSIDKPAGHSSRYILNALNKMIGIKKSGYAGTLDPFATGVLPVALGRATKVLEYFMETDKEYSFTVQFGIATDTDDITGQVIDSMITAVTQSDILNIIDFFVGRIEQTPPRYSAVKINGHRAYDLARDGREFALKSRLVDIFALKLIDFNAVNQQARFWVHCGKGTYIRSLACQIAAKLDVIATTIELRRERVGKFSLDNTFLLDKLKILLHNGQPEGCFFPVDYVLDDIPDIKILSADLQKLRSGQAIDYFTQSDLPLVKLSHEEKFVALGKIHSNRLKTIKIIEL
jgi:tRNA pseudouridine55 synthase